MDIKIKVVKTTEEFMRLRSDWGCLIGKSNKQIFIEFDWLYTWWKYFGSEKDLFLIVAEHENRPIMILPLVRTIRFGFRSLEFMGAEISDYQELLFAGPEDMRPVVMEKVFQVISQQPGWDIFRFGRIREESPNYLMWHQLTGRIHKDFLADIGKHKEGAPYVKINRTWQEYLTISKPNYLPHIRKQWNRLTRLKNVKVVFQSDDIPGFLKALRSQHISRRTKNKQKSFFERDKIFSFLEDVSLVFQEKGWLWLSALKYGDKFMATLMSFCYGNNFYHYISGFDADFQYYSASRLLTAAVLEESFNRQLTVFDFMLGEERYKLDWKPEIMPLHYVYIAPKTLRGRLAFQFFNRIVIGYKKQLGKAW